MRTELYDVREHARKAVEERNLQLAWRAEQLRLLNRVLERKLARQQRFFVATAVGFLLALAALLGWVYSVAGTHNWWVR